MKTREVEFEPGRSEGSSRRRKGLWLAGAGAVLVAVLVIGASAFVFAQSSYVHRQSQTHNLPTGKWVQVLSGYTVSSVVEADGVSSVLYPCATAAQLDVPLPGLPLWAGRPGRRRRPPGYWPRRCPSGQHHRASRARDGLAGRSNVTCHWYRAGRSRSPPFAAGLLKLYVGRARSPACMLSDARAGMRGTQ